MMGLEDKPFPLGPGNLSGANEFLNFGGCKRYAGGAASQMGF